MRNLNKYLNQGSTEAFIPFEKGKTPTSVAKDVNSYCHHFGVKATNETIYGCNAKGEGFRFLHVILDKPIERSKTWR